MPSHYGKMKGGSEPKKMTAKPPAGVMKPKAVKAKSEEPAKKKMKSGSGLAKKGKVPPALQKWMTHLNKVREDNPKLTMKQAMKKAKSTYKK